LMTLARILKKKCLERSLQFSVALRCPIIAHTCKRMENVAN
jgi:hypothetical protein